ncbi:MAG: hypothetical protein UH077_01415 [Bacteroidales bacterium]|nr:hypothetical protein [Bacteroidales bacterium]
MTFQQAINQNPSLRTLYSQMEIQTPMARNLLLHTPFSQSQQWIEQQWQQITECQTYLTTLNPQTTQRFFMHLSTIHDISGSIKALQQNQILDDISLFEIKAFCLNTKKLKKDFTSPLFPLPDLQEIIDILDPEKMQAMQFYIYSAYSEELSQARKQWQKAKEEANEQKAHSLYIKTLEIENQIRQTLTQKLYPYIPALSKSLSIIAQIDLTFAKAKLSTQHNLNKVQITDKKQIHYKKIFHPIVKQLLEEKNQPYQSIDIEIGEENYLITGANMAGKTLILKTLALNQQLLQYGFFVACQEGEVCLVEKVLTSIGDGQNENEGLSSFAYEVKNLHNIIQEIKTNATHLVLVDELARTTNPIEGKKLVEGFLKVCNQKGSFIVVTTHYSNIEAPSKRMRVKGFNHKDLQPPIKIEEISQHIDYSLVEDQSNQAPTEAINLCRLLGIDQEWIGES